MQQKLNKMRVEYLELQTMHRELQEQYQAGSEARKSRDSTRFLAVVDPVGYKSYINIHNYRIIYI